MAEKTPLYSIGHGARKAEELVDLLHRYHIDYLVDVRTYPYSRFHPQFNRPELESLLKENHIQYVFMGDELGGRPKDPSCCDENGRIRHSLVREKDYFKRGIERLKTAYDKNLSLAFMCSERNPADCHRCHMIAPVLMEQGIQVLHIDQEGKLKDQETVLGEKKSQGKNLFDRF